MAIDRQNIKDRFRSEENLSEEFSWENMEQGIQEKLNSKKKRRPQGILYLSTIALVMAIIATGAVYYFNEENIFYSWSSRIIPKF